MKLGKRLQQIENMVSSGYTHIWDTCCDHGLLGAALLEGNMAPNIHFVDIVPELITELEAKLLKFSEKRKTSNLKTTWHTHCIDSAKLPLATYSGHHLVIISGVGGDLVEKIITTITREHPNTSIDFLLCPVHHEYALRQQLIELNFELLNEALVRENQRIYEVILVASPPCRTGIPIHPVGSILWQANNAETRNVCQQYLAKRMQHYQRAQTNQESFARAALAAYKNVIL